MFNALADEENRRAKTSWRKTEYRTSQRCPKNKHGMEIVGSEAAAAAVAALSIQSSITADEDSRASLHDYRSHVRAPSPRAGLF